MKIFGVFPEYHLHPLCNMILGEKDAQALRGTLETSPIFSVLEMCYWNIQHCSHLLPVNF